MKAVFARLQMNMVTIVFAMIALGLIVRLFLLLGARSGHEKPLRRTSVPNVGVDKSFEREITAKRHEKGKSEQTKTQHPFDERAFLQGAESFYEQLVNAFARGDMRRVESYISKELGALYKQMVEERKAQNQTYEVQFVNIEKSWVAGKNLDAPTQTIKVGFHSNQIRTLRDKGGKILKGDPVRIDLVKDLWAFERQARSKDPNWTLVATGTA